MGLAPSKLIDFPEFSVGGEVPVPIFSQPLRVVICDAERRTTLWHDAPRRGPRAVGGLKHPVPELFQDRRQDLSDAPFVIATRFTATRIACTVASTVSVLTPRPRKVWLPYSTVKLTSPRAS